MRPYNTERFIELLNKQADLRKQNEKLISSENTELLGYRVVLYDYICWKNRDEILKLLKQFLDDQMDGTTFDREFLKLWEFNRDLSKFIATKVELINLIEIDPKSSGCSLIVSNLMGFLESYNYPEDEDDNYEDQKKEKGISDELLRDLIENAYQKLLKY
jgi:hypothetical protein